MLVNIALTAE